VKAHLKIYAKNITFMSMKEKKQNKESDFSVSKRFNEFIESLTDNDHCIEITRRGPITTIFYEDWAEHPPIKNHKGKFPDDQKKHHYTKPIKPRKNRILSEEHKKAIKEGMKKRHSGRPNLNERNYK
jgi:hypothetical protein